MGKREEELARQAQAQGRPRGISDAGIASRIPKAEDRKIAQQVEADAARGSAAVAAGYVPGRTAAPRTTNASLNESRPGETPSQVYARQKDSRSGAPAAAETAPPPGPLAPPTLLRPNAGQPKSLIDGEDSGAVLKRMREEAMARFKAGTGPEPFSASKSERDYDSGVARTKAANDRDAANAAATKPETPSPEPGTGVATPKPLVAPPSSAKPPGSPSPETTPASPVAPSPGSSPGTRPPLAALALTAAKAGGEVVDAASTLLAPLQGDLSAAKITAKGFADLGRTAANEANQIGKSLQTLGLNQGGPLATKSAETLGDANRLLGRAKLNFTGARPTPVIQADGIASAARANYKNISGAVAEGARMEADAARRITDIADKTFDAERGVVSATKNLNTVGSKGLRAIEATGRLASKLPGAKLFNKVGGVKTLGTALDVVNTGLLMNELRTKNLEDTSVVSGRSNDLADAMEQGGVTKLAGESLKTAYNLVPARYGGGGQTATEGAALVKSAGDVALRSQEAEGDVTVARQGKAGSERGVEALKRSRRTIVKDEVYDKMTPAMKSQIMKAAAARRNALRPARR